LDPRARRGGRRAAAACCCSAGTPSSTTSSTSALGAIDRLELLEFPVLLGDGVPFSPPGTPQRPLVLEAHQVFPDGTIRHVYTLT
jgi:hypothetical protein